MSFLDNLWDVTTDIAHRVSGIPTADEKRNQQRLISEQVKAYKEQTELTRSEIERKKAEEAVEKRRIEQKQIRSLRRNYRSSGFLGGSSTNQSNNDDTDMNNKLGD